VIRVGVTGHRSLPDEAAIARAVEEALDSIKEKWSAEDNSAPVILLISPIAEGADRLVAREVLKDPTARLKVVLPFPKEDYMNDFETSDSKKEFETLLSRADEVITLPATITRNEGYEQVGLYVLNNCDVLIAIWDGEASRGQGGTAEIVAEARNRGLPLIWIRTKGPRGEL
jgi:hypothetical protein